MENMFIGHGGKWHVRIEGEWSIHSTKESALAAVLSWMESEEREVPSVR